MASAWTCVCGRPPVRRAEGKKRKEEREREIRSEVVELMPAGPQPMETHLVFSSDIFVYGCTWGGWSQSLMAFGFSWPVHLCLCYAECFSFTFFHFGWDYLFPHTWENEQFSSRLCTCSTYCYYTLKFLKYFLQGKILTTVLYHCTVNIFGFWTVKMSPWALRDCYKHFSTTFWLLTKKLIDIKKKKAQSIEKVTIWQNDWHINIILSCCSTTQYSFCVI